MAFGLITLPMALFALHVSAATPASCTQGALGVLSGLFNGPQIKSYCSSQFPLATVTSTSTVTTTPTVIQTTSTPISTVTATPTSVTVIPTPYNAAAAAKVKRRSAVTPVAREAIPSAVAADIGSKVVVKAALPAQHEAREIEDRAILSTLPAIVTAFLAKAGNLAGPLCTCIETAPTTTTTATSTAAAVTSTTTVAGPATTVTQTTFTSTVTRTETYAPCATIDSLPPPRTGGTCGTDPNNCLCRPLTSGESACTDFGFRQSQCPGCSRHEDCGPGRLCVSVACGNTCYTSRTTRCTNPSSAKFLFAKKRAW